MEGKGKIVFYAIGFVFLLVAVVFARRQQPQSANSNLSVGSFAYVPAPDRAALAQISVTRELGLAQNETNLIKAAFGYEVQKLGIAATERTELARFDATKETAKLVSAAEVSKAQLAKDAAISQAQYASTTAIEQARYDFQKTQQQEKSKRNSNTWSGIGGIAKGILGLF